MHTDIPYSHNTDLIANTRKAMSQHKNTKLCFQFLSFYPFPENLNVHDVTGSAYYTRPRVFSLQAPSCYFNQHFTLLNPRPRYTIKGIVFCLGYRWNASVSYGMANNVLKFCWALAGPEALCSLYTAATHFSRRTICYLSKLWWVCLLTDPLLHEGISGPFAAFLLFIPEAWNCDYHSGAHPSHSLIHRRTLNIHICILVSFSSPL